MNDYIKKYKSSKVLKARLNNIANFMDFVLYVILITTFILAKIYYNFPFVFFLYTLIFIASFQLTIAVYFEKTGGIMGVQVTKIKAILWGGARFILFGLPGVILILPYAFHAKIHFFFVGLILLFPVIVIFLRTIRKI